MDNTSDGSSYALPQYGISNQSSTYAFLNHSALSLSSNLPPIVDDKPLARQRRRRTSPEDQVVLEEAYNLDPKPDKAARLELVKRVALGEKEVQIWFQNRRQTSRRKSRPLLPHEIAQYQLSRSGVTTQPSSSNAPSSSPNENELQTDPDVSRNTGADVPGFSSAKIGHNLVSNPAHVNPDVPILPPRTRNLVGSESTTSLSDQEQQTSENARPGIAHVNAHGELIRGSKHLAKRRSEPSLRHTHSLGCSYLPARDATDTTLEQRLRKTKSSVRLSFTSEGDAKVIIKNSLSPSPPRNPQSYQPSIGGSNKVLEAPTTVPPKSNLPAIGSLQRASSGRSRDSRSWEFWCDKDSRSELEVKAEKEASGSAADAIGLLRSSSGRRILGAIPSKRNSMFTRHSTSLKRSKLDPTQAYLHRSSTSFGRLPGKPISKKPEAKLSYSESTHPIHIPDNESDKENWPADPDTAAMQQLETSTHSLNQNLLERAQSSKILRRSVAGTPTHLERSTSNSENVDPEADPELATFMRGNHKSNSVCEEEDMSCVQGLLSLSQGNWR